VAVTVKKQWRNSPLILLPQPQKPSSPRYRAEPRTPLVEALPRCVSHRTADPNNPGMCDMRVGRIGHCGHRECPGQGLSWATPRQHQ